MFGYLFSPVRCLEESHKSEKGPYYNLGPDICPPGQRMDKLKYASKDKPRIMIVYSRESLAMLYLPSNS
jgi:hypothetical protein